MADTKNDQKKKKEKKAEKASKEVTKVDRPEGLFTKFKKMVYRMKALTSYSRYHSFSLFILLTLSL